MVDFPTLPPQPESGIRSRISQRDIFPESVRSRHQLLAEEPRKAIVYKAKGNEFGTFVDIQEAINYLNNLGGGTVFIKNGTYVLSSNIQLFSNINLIGENEESTIIDFDNGNKQFYAVGTSGAKLTNINLANLGIKNSKNSDGAIDLTHIDDSSIIDCRFDNNWDSSASDGSDIFLVGNSCSRLLIERCRSYDSGWFMEGGGAHLIIFGNYSEDSLAGGIKGVALSTTLMQANYINNPASDGIQTDVNSARGFIKDNYIFSMGGYGIRLGSGGQLVEGNYIDGVSAGDHLIFLNSSVIENRIIGNWLEGMADNKSGVFLSGGCNWNQICINHITGGTGASDTGINVSVASCTSNLVGHNFVRNCGTAINDAGTTTTLDNNVSV